MESSIKKLYRWRYEAYLVSLIVLFVGQIFVPANHQAFWQHAIVIQNVLIGLMLFVGVNRYLYYIIVFISMLLVGECLILLWFDTDSIRFTMGALFSLVFILTFVRVFQDLLSTMEVGNEMIAAVFSGFIMLGFIGSFIFTMIEVANPGSFSNLGPDDIKYQNLNYFSFVSLLTIGYGDIAPLTQIAKKVSVLLGLAANFYLTFVTAIVIGKYLNEKQRKRR